MPYDLQAVIGRSIINHDDFDFFQCLVHCRFQALWEIFSRVVNRYYDRYLHVHSIIFARCFRPCLQRHHLRGILLQINLAGFSFFRICTHINISRLVNIENALAAAVLFCLDCQGRDRILTISTINYCGKYGIFSVFLLKKYAVIPKFW